MLIGALRSNVRQQQPITAINTTNAYRLGTDEREAGGRCAIEIGGKPHKQRDRVDDSIDRSTS